MNGQIKTLDAAVERVHTEYPEVAVTAALVERAPAVALLSVGADAGLIVVGSHGYAPLAGRLLGSVSHAVLHRSTRPAAVVRGGMAPHFSAPKTLAPAVAAVR